MKTYYCKVTNLKIAEAITQIARDTKRAVFGTGAITPWSGPVYPILATAGNLDHSGNEAWCNQRGYIEVSIGDFVKLPEETPVPIKPILIPLNSEYTAEVSKETVKVGCQTIPWSKIEEIVEAHTELS